MDLTGWNRKKACLINGCAMLLLSLPCALGFNLLSGVHPLGEGTNFMDLEDFIVSNVLLPLGAVVYILFCTRKAGWGWENFIAEANTGKGLKVPNWIRGYATYVLPAVMVIIFIIGIVSYI